MLDLRKMAIKLIAMAIIICGINTPLCAYAESDQEIVIQAKNDLYIEYSNSDYKGYVTENITLPTSGYDNSLISWSSSDNRYVSVTGEVYRPSFIDGDKNITLTASISKNGSYDQKSFDLTVIRKPLTDRETLIIAKDNLHIKYANSDSAKKVTKDIVLPKKAFNNTLVSWESSNERYIDVTGKVYRPDLLEGDMDVTVTANVYKNGLYDRKRFDLTVLKDVYAMTDEQAVQEAIENLEIGYSYGDSYYSVTQDVYLPDRGLNDTFVLWSSNNERYIDVSGHVYRPDYFSGNKYVTVSGTVYKNDTYRQKDFLLTVIANPMTDRDAVMQEINSLQIGYAYGDNSNNVTKDMTFKKYGSYGTSISWLSSSEKHVSVTGQVYRPDYFEGDKDLTVCATVYKNGYSDYKFFDLSVIKLPPNDYETTVIAADNLNINFAKSDYPGSVKSDMSFPTSGYNYTDISWQSYSPQYVSDTGKVTRPDYIDGDQHVTVVASVYKNKARYNKYFDLLIDKMPETDYDSVQIAADNLNIGFATCDYDQSVTQDVYLPSEGYNGTSIHWSLPYYQDSYYICFTGDVSRPYDSDKTVTLVAEIRKNEVTCKKEFKLKIQKW